MAANAKSRIPQPILTQDLASSPQPKSQQQQKSNFGPGQSALILDSPTSDSAPEVVVKEPLKPAIPEPSWQILSPPSSTTSSSAGSYRKRSPSSASSVQTHVTQPSIDESDPNLKSAVEISIARQISISQQQRQLLQPLKTDISRPGGRETSPAGSGGKSPVRKLTVGKNERLGEAKSATPTLIHPGEKFDSPLAQHRKSERIVVEGA
jgi:hypothetical protein